MLSICLPEGVRFILDTLQAHHHEAFIVGGCVRDSLMGKVPKDWDITTAALPLDVKKIFPHTFDTGLQHGTVTVVHKRVNYEVTTYRVDGAYTDNRRPDTVTFAANIEDDLSRRDFTMNAIAYNPNRGFVDPFEGQEDIKCNIICCVGTATHRFNEDALRMLRAIRFAAQLGFEIEKKTLDAIPLYKNNLSFISAERIREELTRLLTSRHIEKIMLLPSTGLLPYVLIGSTYGGDLTTVIPCLQECPAEIRLRAAVFFSWAGDKSPTLLRDLRFDNKTIREVSTLIQHLPTPVPCDRYAIKKLMNLISPGLTEDLTILQKNTEARALLHDILSAGECYTLRDLTVKGNDLTTLGIPPGEGMGRILNNLLDKVMRNPEMNNYETLVRIIPVQYS